VQKICLRCGVTRPLDAFYAHPGMRDGRLGKCKDCTKADVRANRLARRDQYLAYERGRSVTPERKRAIKRNRARHKHLASVAVHNAVARGTLEKRPCEVCRSPESEAHHTDYSKPLEVMWLCRAHHVAWHREHGEVE
jgi:hypothetical protein